MQSNLSKLLPVVLAASFCSAGVAGDKSGPLVSQPPSSSAGVINDWLREQIPAARAWDLGAQARARFEAKTHFAVPTTPGAVDFNRGSPIAQNNYLLLRERVHLGYTPCDWFTIFGQAQNSSSTGDRRNPNPESDGLVDLRQAWVRLGNLKEFPLEARVGRQELSYGEERLIGAFDWNNIGRVFDAAKVRFQQDALWVEAFSGRVVIPDDNNFNLANDYDWFSGIYASSTTICPKQESQIYFLSRNTSVKSPSVAGSGGRGVSPRDIYTAGLRFKSLPGQLKGWDYSAELACQFGRFKTGPAAMSQDHLAYAAHLAGGYTWRNAWGTPRLGLEYNYASGDDNAADGDHGTFDNLFPTNHKFYGYMDFVSWQNIHNVRLATSLKPLKKLTVTADYHAFWLADNNDFFYMASGASRPASPAGYGINPTAGSYVGSEVDVVATYAIRPYAVAQAGYGHFFVGDYPKKALTAGAKDADYFYLQLVLNF